MASAFERDGKLYIKWKDAHGRWRMKRTKAKTKTEARRLADDLERKCERQALGLEALPTDTAMTLWELCSWWLTHHCPETSRAIETGRLEKHIRGPLEKPHPIGALPLPKVTAEAFEEHLDGLAAQLEPASLNKIRSMVHSAFERARKKRQNGQAVWAGPNPIADVEPRTVVKKKFGTLAADEVPLLLLYVRAEWRNYFAAALWLALRKGELCGLRKVDVDLKNRTVFVGHSYDRDTTKGGHEDYLPIAEPLVPFLEDAIRRSPSQWVFPKPDGSMREDDSRPEKILRTALKRAGMVEGFLYVCRWCKPRHEERHPDMREERRCPTCARKLWPKAIPRNMRFHDLRHTVVTLLLRAGVDPHRVQRVARHADIRTTLGTYGHLMVEDLRGAVQALPTLSEALGASLVRLPAPPAPAPVVEGEIISRSEDLESGRSRDRTCDSCRVNPCRCPDSWSENQDLRDASTNLHSSDSILLQALRPVSTPFGAPVVQRSGYPSLEPGLLTVRMVADRLKVSTAMVYKLVDRGELPAVRVSNSIRIRPADLDAYTRR